MAFFDLSYSRKAFIAVLLLASRFAVCGQGTIQFGFEEYGVGTLPPFVTKPDPFGATPGVLDNTTLSYIQAFEGQKYLIAYGRIVIGSPDGQPIQSFTLHLFTRPPLGVSQLSFGIQGQTTPIGEYGTWQTLRGTFESPSSGLSILAFDHVAGEILGAHQYAIDSVELTTVPEPRASWLFVLVLSAVVIRSRLKGQLKDA